jgi:hypothetical protein
MAATKSPAVSSSHLGESLVCAKAVVEINTASRKRALGFMAGIILSADRFKD